MILIKAYHKDCNRKLLKAFFLHKTMKLIQRRVPGGRTAVHTKREKTSKHKCAICKGLLHGTPRGTRVDIKRIKKSRRSPSRPFGGQLCTQCTRKVIYLQAELKGKLIEAKDVPISLREYV